MENKLIEPWVESEELRNESEFFVPDYITQYAYDVLKQYNLSVKSMNVVTTKSDKGGAIWKLETNAGPKSLKLLHRRPTRSLFSLGAQEYLVDVQKANVPPIIKSKDGASFIEAGGKCWFVAEWIEPLAPVTKDLEGAKQLCHALGEFHRLSQGYVPPQQAELPSRLYKWPKSYQKVIDKMDWFRNLANAYKEMPASSAVLEVVGQFEQQAQQGYEALRQSRYDDLTRLGNESWGLVHQDYGWSNGQMGADGMWIIDLDGVAYDIPIRDLRKLITGTMADLFKWDATWVREMIRAYHEANPISQELYDILMIDLAMPNEFYKNIKEIVYEPELFLNDETTAMIRTIVETDQTKWPVLEEVKRDRDKFTPFNFDLIFKDTENNDWSKNYQLAAVQTANEQATKEENKNEKAKDKTKEKAKEKATVKDKSRDKDKKEKAKDKAKNNTKTDKDKKEKNTKEKDRKNKKEGKKKK